MTITAAADGSALRNPGPAGWAWYVDDDRWAAGGWPHGTNNIGELTAVLELFRATAHLDDDLLIICDSQYVINAVTKWMPGWKRKGWRKADGSPVMNVELLKELDAVIVGRRYRFEWIKGHSGHALNEAADERARAAAEAYQRGDAPNPGPGFGGAAAAGQDVATAASSDAVAAASGNAQAVGAESLFDLDLEPGEPEYRDVTVQLDAFAHERLAQRARAAGLTPEDLLRSLI